MVFTVIPPLLHQPQVTRDILMYTASKREILFLKGQSGMTVSLNSTIFVMNYLEPKESSLCVEFSESQLM